MSKLIKINKEFSTGAYPFPVIWGNLDCGHSCSVPVKPDVKQCTACGVKAAPLKNAPCACGGVIFTYITHNQSNCHNPETWALQLGALVECERCPQDAESYDFVRANVGKIIYTRSRWGSIHCYQRDYTSPSGVMLLCSIPDNAKSEALLRELRLAAPLSPTEGLRR